jgi:glycosyltransferase involved in cell wall biosynthesis
VNAIVVTRLRSSKVRVASPLSAGGREYFDPLFTYFIEVGDVVGVAKAVEDVLGVEQREPGMLERKGKQAAEYVRANYSPEREAHDIVRVWETIVKQRNARS